MSFVRFWIAATVIGLAVTAAILSWAFGRRQFAEPDRAAHLPLAGLDGAPPRSRPSRDTAVMVGVLGLGLASLVATVIVAMMTP